MTSTDPMFDPSDLDDERYYCAHGTFIGNPYGADYMCFHCEMGTTDEEYAAILSNAESRRIRRRISEDFIAQAFNNAAISSMRRAPDSLLQQPLGLLSAFGRLVGR